MGWFYNLVIGVFGLIIASLAFVDEIASKVKYFERIKSLLFKIPIFIISSFFVIWATVQKDNEIEKASRDDMDSLRAEITRLNIEYANRIQKADSANSQKILNAVDSSYQRSIRESNSALGKYNLVLTDSLDKVVSKINNKSAIAQLSVVAADESSPPMYTIKVDGKRFLCVKVESRNGTCYNLNVNCFYIVVSKSNMRILDFVKDESKNEFLADNRFRTFKFRVPFVGGTQENIIVFLTGSFSRDNEGLNVVPYREGFLYSFTNDKYIGRQSYLDLTEVDKYLLENGIR